MLNQSKQTNMFAQLKRGSDIITRGRIQLARREDSRRRSIQAQDDRLRYLIYDLLVARELIEGSAITETSAYGELNLLYQISRECVMQKHLSAARAFVGEARKVLEEGDEYGFACHFQMMAEQIESNLGSGFPDVPLASHLADSVALLGLAR